MRAITALLIVAMVPAITKAQIMFDHVYGDSGFDFGFSVQQTSDGGYILAGGSDTGEPNGTDMYLVKTDTYGGVQWQQTYGEQLLDLAYSVSQTADGGYVICGTFNGFGGDTLSIIRTDQQGEVIWEHQYPGSVGRDIGYSVVQTMDGGFAVSGFVGSGQATDVYVVKVDALGDLQWSTAVDLGAEEYGNTIRQLADGGFIVLADNGEVPEAVADMYLIRFNVMGDTLWTRSFGTPEADAARGLWVNDDGGFILAGGRDYPNRDIFLLRTDDQGNELWRRFHGDPTRDEMAMDVQQLDDGGFIFCGREENAVTDDVVMHLFRTDGDGFISWEREFPRGIFSEGISLDSTTDGGFVIVGSTADTLGGFAFTDMFLVKTDATGYVTVDEVGTSGEGVAIWPNPVSELLSVSAPDGVFDRITLFDICGRVVTTAALNSSVRTEISVTMLPNGVYAAMASGPNGCDHRSTVVIAR